MRQKTKAANLTTYKKVKVNSFLTEFSATKIVMWGYNVDKSTKRMYSMIIGRYLQTVSGLNLNYSEHVI